MIMSTLLVALAASQPAPSPGSELRELLPGIRVGDKVVEFEGEICINAHHPDTPDVYLEMLVTAPDSREHESLVMADIRPSNLHAGLLAAGFVSGSPLSRDDEGKLVQAHGDGLMVMIGVIADEEDDEQDADPPALVPITDWVMRVDDESPLLDAEHWEGLVFAGSRFRRHEYEADGAGTLISLTSFGNEVIAPRWTLSPNAAIDEPVWIANRELIPEKGTRVLVRIEAEPESHEPERVDIDGDP
jgi:hypothetical protein